MPKKAFLKCVFLRPAVIFSFKFDPQAKKSGHPCDIPSQLGLAGHIWPAGRILCMPAVDHTSVFLTLGCP